MIPHSHEGDPTARESEILRLASSLAYVRPLVPYPGWRFDVDWENPDFAFQLRRRIWLYCMESQREHPLEIPWYNGLRLRLFLPNDLSKQLFVAGCIEPNEFFFLHNVLADGMTVVDVGANEGLYTLFASRRVGARGQVWAFEPSSREYARLEHNVELNRLSNVRLFRAGLSDRNDQGDLLIADPEHAGQNTLGGFMYEGVKPAGRESVELRRLDDLAEERHLSRLDVLKIDAEGAEVRVLNGARRLLRSFRPLLLFEVSPDALLLQQSSPDQLLELLRSLEYSLYAFDQETGLPAPAITPAAPCNMIAAPAERQLPEAVLADCLDRYISVLRL